MQREHAAQADAPYEYLSSALKIVRVGSDGDAIYGEPRVLFKSASYSPVVWLSLGPSRTGSSYALGLHITL